MRILGFSNEHDSGIAFVESGRILYAANEERFTREKFCMADPEGSFLAGKNQFPDFPGSIDVVAVSSRMHIGEHIAVWSEKKNKLRAIINIVTLLRLHRILFGTLWGVKLTVFLMRLTQLFRTRTIRALLRRWGISAPVVYVDHHTCHAAGAYFTSTWPRALVITLDAQGDGVSSRVFLGEDGSLRPLHAVPFLHSPGHYYVYITKLLGFKVGREGKVTGLAARGDWRRTLPIFESRMTFDKKHLWFIDHGKYRHHELAYLREKLKEFSREDISAGIQKHLENLVTAYVRGLIRRYVGHPIPVVLAGGVFANVRLNQRIKELQEVSGVYIYPHMGDGGLAAGAAMATEAARARLAPEPLYDAYLGPAYKETEIVAALERSHCVYRKSAEIAQEVARYLAAGRVVAVCRGRMEYGPRALGNRSILYQATDPTVNDWLNKRLNRSEFMPFAPILRKQHIDKYFCDWKPCEKALEFMTITLDASERCKKEAPAVVHVDGTARPQVVLRNVHPFMETVLAHYEKLTGLCVLINTSFNMHEEPIVCTPDDATRSFLQSNLDVLALESYIIERA